jgi:hypothetical protein
VDRFFDILNSRNLDESILKRKPDLSPISSIDDPRLKVIGCAARHLFTSILYVILQWLKENFLAYLDEWEQSVNGRTGFTVAEKRKMMLSRETIEGIRITRIAFHSNDNAQFN